MNTIAQLSRACENTSNPRHRASLNTERHVAEKLLGRGYHLLYHRRRFFGVEIDLVMSFQGVVHFVEVKKYTSETMLRHRLTPNQKRRLLYAKTYFESAFQLPVEVLLVLVDRDGGMLEFVVGQSV